MKIVHVSDIHIRNLKYHPEYRRVFEDLYVRLREIRPDLIINTGDTAHTKTQISPEFVAMTAEHIRRVSQIAPYHIILGNHDLNLMNLDRQDAITPIVDSLRTPSEIPRVHLHKKSGLVRMRKPCPPECEACETVEGHMFDRSPGKHVNFWVFSLADTENYPTPGQWAKYPEDINIGLFHGAISSCVTDSNWRMTHTEHDVGIFDGLDYVLMGDIHKQQFIGEGRRIGYAGSLIQQNFGEDPDKGFLLWDIESKTKHTVTPYVLRGSRKFYTIRLNEDLTVPDVQVEEDSRIRVSPPRDMTLAQQKEIERIVRKKYRPHDIITLAAANVGTQRQRVAKQDILHEDIRLVGVQERLLRDYLSEKGASDKVIERALELNRRYQIHIDQGDETARNVSWKVNKILWSNLFNYGEGNVIDFSCLGGLTGIFAPNAAGKSNLIDVLLETCFDGTTRGITKNIFLINDNKESASMVADVTANEQDYVIERVIERVKGGKKADWGKTTANFSAIDPDGAQESLTGVTRPETERAIRQRLGTYEDALLTSVSAQWNPLDIIACKETKRKEILFRFLDLDIFEQKRHLAKDESRQHYDTLKELEGSGLEEHAARLRDDVAKTELAIGEAQRRISILKMEIEGYELQAMELAEKKVPVEIDVDIAATALKVKRSEQEVAKLREQVAEKESRLAEVVAELTKLDRLEQKFDLVLHEEKSDELEHVEQELRDLDRDMRGKRQATDGHRKSVVLLQEVPCGDQFPQCKFLINAFESKRLLPTFAQDMESMERTRAQLEGRRAELEKFRGKLETYRKFVGERASLETRRENIRLQLENMQLRVQGFEAEREKALVDAARYQKAEDDLRKNRELDEKISAFGREKSRAQAELKRAQDGVNELSRKMGSDQGILSKLSEQLGRLDEVRELCNAYEHYIAAMGKDGIAYRILTQKLPLINEEINKILSNACQFNVLIEHDNEEQSIRLYIQYGEYKMRLIELGSGAEKMLASIAIRAALMNVSNLPKPNMFVIDEGFGKLDPEKFESVTRMFDYLRTVFDHVIVISHLETMRDAVDNVIEITSDDEGYAHVEVGG